RDGEAEMLEVVAGIGDHQEVGAGHDAAQPERELGAANAAAQRDDEGFARIAGGAHRNKSSSAERISAAAGDGAPDQARPRTSTVGRPSSPCPMMSDAALAISSANPVWVTRSSCPNRSGRPRKSISAGSPAAPKIGRAHV